MEEPQASRVGQAPCLPHILSGAPRHLSDTPHSVLPVHPNQVVKDRYKSPFLQSTANDDVSLYNGRYSATSGRLQ
ncbi:UNVERIFIED_CONTAM: hypothetical protein FKN15_056940 [Acipenser sinensis]